MKDMKKTKAELVTELRDLRERLFRAEAALDGRADAVARAVREERSGRESVEALSTRFAMAQRIARFGCWDWDLGTGAHVWTEETFKIFGVSPETFEPGFDTGLERVHPEDRHRFRAAMNRALTDPDTGISLHHRIIHDDGTIRHIHTRGEVIRESGGRAQRMVGVCQDVTDQRLADNALHESQRRFALFMDHLPAAVMIKNQDGKVLYSNKFMDEVFSPALFRSEPARDGSARRIIDRMLADDRRALRDGLHEREEHVPDAKGGYRWLRTLKFAIPRDEEPPLLGGIAWDITERREAEAALHESEVRYRSLWNNAPVGLWLEDCSEVVKHLDALRARGVTDLDVFFDEHPEELRRCATLIKVLSVNQAAVDMNRADSAEQLCGRLDQLLDESSLQVLRRVLDAIVEGRTSVDFESEIRTPDGETRSIAMRLFTPPEYRRTWRQSIIAATDFTEQKRLWRNLALRTRELAALHDLTRNAGEEDTLDAVLDASVGGVCEATASDLAVIFLDEGGELVLRSARLDGVPAATPDWAVTDGLEDACTAAADAGSPIYRDDQPGAFSACAALPLFGGGQRIGVLALGSRAPRDYAAQAPFLETLAHEIALAVVNSRLQERIREFGARLEDQVAAGTRGLTDAVRRSGDAVGDEVLDQVSHELRTPLTSIIGFIGVILQGLAGAINDEQRRQLGMAGVSAAHLLTLVDDVIDLTRIRTGRMGVGREPVDLGDLLVQAGQKIRPAVLAKDLSIDVDVPADLPSVLGDAARLRKTVDHLLDNAVRFTSAGSIALVCERDGAWVVTRISDTGAGVPLEAQARIFTPFQGADSATGTRGEGTGLGLFISRAVIEMMGGELTLDSTPGVGSTFVLRLPAGEAT